VITNFRMGRNIFGGHTAVARIILEGLSSNTALRQLDLGVCEVDD
jgi:hypothetical protein